MNDEASDQMGSRRRLASILVKLAPWVLFFAGQLLWSWMSSDYKAIKAERSPHAFLSERLDSPGGRSDLLFILRSNDHQRGLVFRSPDGTVVPYANGPSNAARALMPGWGDQSREFRIPEGGDFFLLWPDETEPIQPHYSSTMGSTLPPLELMTEQEVFDLKRDAILASGRYFGLFVMLIVIGRAVPRDTLVQVWKDLLSLIR